MSNRSFWKAAHYTIVLIVVILTGFGILNRLYPINLARYQDLSPIVVDINNELLAALLAKDERYRFSVQVKEVDPMFIKMLIAFEDKRFYYHPGVDPFALLRAVGQYVSSGRIVSGASTLTLQTVRLLEPRTRTLKNKIKEFVRALQLEWHFSKTEILQIYLTLAPFGRNIEGIRTASLAYFDKEPRHLTLAESALLIALPQQPTRLRPDVYPIRARFHRDKIIRRMHAKALLSKEQIRQAVEDNLNVKKKPFPRLALHLAYRLKREYPTEPIHFTYVNKTIQQPVEAFLRQLSPSLAPSQSVAVLVVENKTRQVVAYVGSNDFFGENRCGQIDMVRAIRSPGSTLKPFIYAMGFEEGIIHPETTIDDVPSGFKGYAPTNFKDIFHGRVSIREALQQSLNIPAVAILDQIGPGRFAAHLRDFGITLKFEKSTTVATLPIALGGLGMRLDDLVSMYAALANYGDFQPLKLLKRDKLPQLKARMLVTSISADQVNKILVETPAPEGFIDWRVTHHVPVAYKTGTSYGFRDAWAVGFTPDFTIGVWVGKPDGTPSFNLTGRTTAAPILFKMVTLLPIHNHAMLPAPKENVETKIQTPSLAHFKPKAKVGHDKTDFRLLFPTEGALINFERASIHITLTGGKPPYYVFENGEPLPLAFQDSKIIWKPKKRGFVELTLIDSDGHATTANIRLQ